MWFLETKVYNQLLFPFCRCGSCSTEKLTTIHITALTFQRKECEINVLPLSFKAQSAEPVLPQREMTQPGGCGCSGVRLPPALCDSSHTASSFCLVSSPMKCNHRATHPVGRWWGWKETAQEMLLPRVWHMTSVSQVSGIHPQGTGYPGPGP